MPQYGRGMTIPDDENKPAQPADGSVPPPAAPVPPADSFPPAAPPAPPAPGAFPASAAPAAPVAAPSAPPSTVNNAFWLYIVAAVLSVVSGIIAAIAVGGSRAAIIDQLHNQNVTTNGLSVEQVADAAIAFAVTWSIITLVFWTLVFVLFAVFMRRGAGWARIVLTILTVLSLLNILSVLSTFGVSALQTVAAVIALILMWLRPSSEYFAAVKASKAPRV